MTNQISQNLSWFRQPAISNYLTTDNFDYDWLRFKGYLGNVGLIMFAQVFAGMHCLKQQVRAVSGLANDDFCNCHLRGKIMKQQRIDPGWAWTKKYNLSAGVKFGDTVQLSGLVAFDSEGNIVGEGNVYAQTKQIFANIKEALASAGAEMSDVVTITTYLTDITSYSEFGKARSEAFPDGVSSSTAVSVPALIMPELLVEVTAQAVIGSGS